MAREWTRDELRRQLFTLLSNGDKVNPQSIEHIEGFYSSAKRLHGSYEEFLIDNGLSPAKHFHRNRNLNMIKSAAGLLFEEVLGDLLDELKLTTIQETIAGCRPDFIVRTPVCEKWIDAKLTELTALRSSSISKYPTHCDKLILIYLIGDDKDYSITDKVRVVSVNRFIDMLPTEEAKEIYRKKLRLIVKIADATDKELQEFGEIVDYAEVI